jgi:serine acetyltransferase
MKESRLRGLLNRIYQQLARAVPGASTLRVALHRRRGVKIGRNVWIGYDVVLDTSRPYAITLGDDCVLSLRVTLLAHFRDVEGITIGRDAFIGAGALILPGVVIGEGAVVSAGSVVTRSVAPFTMVGRANTMKEFTRSLRPIASRGPKSSAPTTPKDMALKREGNKQ